MDHQKTVLIFLAEVKESVKLITWPISQIDNVPSTHGCTWNIMDLNISKNKKSPEPPPKKGVWL